MASSRRLAQVDWKSTGIFLRNIPAKCDEQTLRNFVQAKRVTDFSAEMAVFPNGNAKGFASFRFSERSAMQDFVSKVPWPVHPTESRRFLRSRSYMPASSQPWAPEPREHSSISGAGQSSTGSYGKSKGTTGFSTMVSGREFQFEPGHRGTTSAACMMEVASEATSGVMVIDQQPACTTLLCPDGTLRFLL